MSPCVPFPRAVKDSGYQPLGTEPLLPDERVVEMPYDGSVPLKDSDLSDIPAPIPVDVTAELVRVRTGAPCVRVCVSHAP